MQRLFGSNTYVEVSSVSNARGHQARRGNIRYRPAGSDKAAYTPTPSTPRPSPPAVRCPRSSKSTSDPDGTVTVPETLRRWGGAGAGVLDEQ
ncbi:hypothetical protein [Streptomyces sp. TLI_146]|uniref:hypothetical protein n=1 Tax=Streptomyces sp. TLI_146 TaxID=1938858 RepID=UPI0015D573F2|nr:hypothetical protein [Streptomyces sp. TLI_146]